MNKPIPLPITPVLAACLLLTNTLARASSEIVMQELGSAEVTDVQDALSETPTKSDTLVVEGKFAGRKGEELVLEAGELIIRPNAATGTRKTPVIYLDRIDLSVEKDINIEAGGINVEGGRLFWGGTATIGSGSGPTPAVLEVMPGPSKVEGHDLKFGPNSVFTIRFYTRDRVNRFVQGDPAVKPVQLGGTLDLSSGTKLRITFDERIAEALPAGDYPLIRASEIRGNAPAISQVQGTDALDLSKLSCQIRDNELVLSVAP
jgi:hypothetical protein